MGWLFGVVWVARCFEEVLMFVRALCMENIICKTTEKLWEPGWHLRTPSYSWVHLSNRPLTTLHSSRSSGGGSSMISS